MSANNPNKELLLTASEETEEQNLILLKKIYQESSTAFYQDDSRSPDATVLVSNPRELSQLPNGRKGSQVINGVLQDQKEIFSWTVFFEFTVYFFTFYFLIGPLTGIILSQIYTKHFAWNLGFYGNTQTFWRQTLLWAINVYINFVSPFILENDFYYVQIYMSIVTSCCLIIACSTKYATFSSEQINRIKRHRSSHCEMVKDQTLKSWKEQETKKVYQEVFTAMFENQINPDLFWINFFVPLDQTTAQRFSRRSTVFTNSIASDEGLIEKGEDLSNNAIKKLDHYHALNIVLDFIQNFPTISISSFWFRLCDVISGLRGLIPILFYALNYTLNVGEWAQLIIFAAINFRYFASTNYFLVVHLNDLARKVYFMEQLTYLLAPRKFEGYESKKLFPTMNLLLPKNLKTWNSLRNICLSYGKLYDERTQRDTSIRFMLYAVIFAIWYATTLNMAKGSLISKTWICLVAVAFLEILNIFAIAFMVFVNGTLINDYYTKHKRILMETKIFYLDITRKIDYYFYKENIEPLNYLYKIIINSLKDIYQQHEGDHHHDLTKIKNHLKLLINGADELMQDLELESNLNPFTVFGIKNTKQFLVGLLATLVSLIATIVIVFLSER